MRINGMRLLSYTVCFTLDLAPTRRPYPSDPVCRKPVRTTVPEVPVARAR